MQALYAGRLLIDLIHQTISVTFRHERHRHATMVTYFINISSKQRTAPDQPTCIPLNGFSWLFVIFSNIMAINSTVHKKVWLIAKLLYFKNSLFCMNVGSMPLEGNLLSAIMGFFYFRTRQFASVSFLPFLR